MQELESLLAKRETPVTVGFDHLKHRVWCYADVINICSSHVISSITSVSRPYLSELKVPVDPNPNFRDDNDDDKFDDDNNDTNCNVDELVLDQCYIMTLVTLNSKNGLRVSSTIPSRHARRLICLLHFSDQRREGFRRFIQDRNKRNWFFARDESGKRCPVEVPVLQLLRDVKTRWDSVYTMLEHLRQLQPVSLFQPLGDWTLTN